MSDAGLIILLAIVLCGILAWLLVPRKKLPGKPTASAPGQGFESLPGAKHYAYFPQIRRALSRDDAQYLAKNASARVANQALRERRAVARRFLQGLHDDFSNLARMGRTIAALSPDISHRQETQRLMLSVKFQVLYTLVWLRLTVGMLPLDQLETLAGLVGRLATRIDEAMTEISALSAGQFASKLNV
jgi:hypothetical protein